MRIIQVLVGINAACGIAAFLIARGAIRKLKRELGLESKNLDEKEEEHVGERGH